MKLTKSDKEYLKDIGYAVRDFEQIEEATGKTVYTMVDENTGERTKINTAKAIEILGRKAYLSGISRSAFHWSCVRETDKLGVLIYFDSSRLFKQRYDSIHAVMDFTEVLKNEPGKAFDFISCNAYRFEKDDLVNILKEVLYSLKYHIGGSFYGTLYADILSDVQIELDDDYDEAYQEYDEWIKSIK